MAMLEAHDFRPSMVRFIEATRAAPDILIDVDLADGSTVLDVGAYEGEWSQRILQRAAEREVRDLQVHAFEPEPGAIGELQRLFGDDPRIHVHPFGLSGRDRLAQLAVGGLGSSVFVDPASPGFVATAEVELRAVDGVLASLGVHRIDLLKINIEGGEYELLDRLHETAWLARTGTVIVQFHEFGPNAHRARRRNRRQLARTHRCTWSYPWVYERWDPREGGQ
jgi:FkbM family methyltransferase